MKKSFITEIDISKSEIKEEPDWWTVRGTATDDSLRDSDGELIKVDGMDTSRVGVSSMFKYEHNDDDPGVFLGPIDRAEKINGRLILEGRLLKSLPSAVKVVALMKALSTVGRKMRLSIEGKALLKDPKDKSIITKSYLTNCSFTLMPKNKGTEVEIIKSDNASKNGGNIDSLVDIFNEETGERVIVDKNYRIKIEKMDLKKTMSIESNLSAVQKEDVEAGKPKIFSKSETYNYIFENFTTDIKKSKEIYSIIKETHNILNNTEDMDNISEEAISKAKELLNIAKSETSKTETKIEKSDEEKEYDSLMKKAEDMKAKFTKPEGKGGDKKEEAKDEEAKDEEAKDEDEEEDKKVEKSESNTLEAKNDMIYKSVLDKLDALGTLIQSKDAQNEELKKSLTNVERINVALSERLNLIEKTPVGRKVQTTAVVDRFEKSETGKDEGKEIYSLSQDREALLDRMYDLSNLKKGENVDHTLVKGFQNLECSRKLSGNPMETQQIISKLSKEYNIHLTE